MLTIKNRAVAGFLLLPLVVGVVLSVTGCKPPGARALLDGKKLLTKGKYPAAVERLRTATSLLATNAHAWNYLGLACHNASLPNEAALAYQKAIALNPNLAEAHYNFGCLLLEQNNPAAARGELTAYVMSRPKDASGWLRLGVAQWRTQDFAAAEKSLSESLRFDGKNPEAWNVLGLTQLQRNRGREAASYFATALKYQPDYAPALLNSAIVQQQYLGNRPAALQQYREYLALRSLPPHQEAVASLARALEAELNPPPPPVAVAKPSPPPPAPRPAPTNLVALPVRPPPTTSTVAQAAVPPARTSPPAQIASTSPPKPEAVTEAPPTPPTVTVATPKTNPPAKSILVETFDATASNPPPAKKVWPEVTPLPPLEPAKTNAPDTNPPIKPPTVEVVKLTNEPPIMAAQDVTSAPADTTSKPVEPKPFLRYKYRSLSKLAPGNRAECETYFAQGLQLHERSKLPEALAAFRSAAKADPGYFKAHYNLGWTAFAMKDWATALAGYETALAIDPDSLDARYNFALTLKQAGYPQDAVNELERVLARRPQDAAAHFALANLYAKQLNSPRLARPHYQKVLEIDPSHPQGTQIRYWLSENPL
jgi:tetratricopeptide (TPR) repeat protein